MSDLLADRVPNWGLADGPPSRPDVVALIDTHQARTSPVSWDQNIGELVPAGARTKRWATTVVRGVLCLRPRVRRGARPLAYRAGQFVPVFVAEIEQHSPIGDLAVADAGERSGVLASSPRSTIPPRCGEMPSRSTATGTRPPRKPARLVQERQLKEPRRPTSYSRSSARWRDRPPDRPVSLKRGRRETHSTSSEAICSARCATCGQHWDREQKGATALCDRPAPHSMP
jgi:hypothetical protein